MHTHRPPPARLQHRQIPGSLGFNHHAKTVLLPGNIHVHRTVRGNLQKDPGVGSALVILPRGVQKARAEAQAGSHPFRIPHLVPEALDHRLVLGEHGQKCQRGKVVSGMNLVEVRAQIPGQRRCRRRCLQRGRIGLRSIELYALIHQYRLPLRKLAGLLVGRGQRTCFNFGRLHIRLVERIDPHHRAGYSRGHLPGEELPEDLVQIRNLDMHHRMPGSLQGRNLGVLALVGRPRQADIGKDAVLAVNLRRRNGLSIHRRNALAQLARGFGNQLLQPRPQVVDLRRSEDGDLVPPGVGCRAQDQAKLDSGIFSRRQLGRCHRLGRLSQQLARIQARHRRRHHAKVR